MRALKWTIKGLVLLLIIAVAALAILLGTADGIAWLVRTADDNIPADLRVEKVTGGLFGDLRIDGFHYSDPAMAVEVASLVLRWAPRELLQRRLHIVQLSVADGRFEQLQVSEPEQPEESGEALALPDIDLPLAILLDRISVTDFSLITAPGADPMVLEQVLLRAEAEGSTLNLKTLEVVLRDMLELQADAQVQTAGEWPLELHNTLQLSLPELPAFAVSGGVSGDLQSLSLQQTVSGGVAAELSAEAKDPLGQLSWQIELTLSKLSEEVVKLAGIALPDELSMDLKGDGDLKQANAAVDLQLGTLAAGSAEQATADSDSGREARKGSTDVPTPEKPSQQAAAQAPLPSFIKLTGSVQFEELEFQAQGQWQELQWPLVGIPLVVTETGGVEVKGSAEAYDFSFKAHIDGPDIPPGDWSAQGSGSTESAQLDALKGDLLGGQLQAQAKVAWAPQLDWQASLSGSSINPGLIAAEWPGSVGFALSTTGTIDDDRQRVVVVIEKLDGTLRERPLGGGGEFRMDGEEMAFKDIKFSSGKAVVKANGELKQHWDLDWGVDVADLAELLPEGQGRFQAKGKLSGDAKLPNVQATLAAGGIHFQELQLQRLDGDIDLKLNAKGDGKVGDEAVANIKLSARELGTAGDLVESLDVDIKGPLTAQTIHIAAAHPLVAVTVDAKGALNLDGSQWQGKLARLDLDAGEWGKWGLKSPVTVSASPQAVKTSQLCLREGGTALCADVDWQPDGGSANASLQGLSFDRLKPLLPENLTELSGGVNAKLAATLGEPIGATLDLNLEPGRITYLADETHQVRLTYQGGGLDANYDQNALAAKLKLEMEDSGIDANVSIPRAALDKDPHSAPLAGKLNFDFKQLGLVTAFAPVIEKSEGLLNGRLKLGGVLGAPEIGGDIVLDMVALVIPDAGLDLKDLKLALNGKGTQLRLSGGVSSGPGRLDLGGQADLDAAKGWPAKLTLKGDRFQAVALPEAMVLISPDIQVEHGEQGLKIRGSITIPKTRIELNEIPAGSRSVSSDLVIVDSNTTEEELQSGLPIDAQVTVILGKDVQFRGFGLTADLGGKLTVIQKPGSLPVGNGELGIEKGSFRSFGQELDIDRGKVFYAGGSLTNPGLNIRASREVNDLTVGVLVTGTAKKPVVKAFSSDPAMKERDARSLLLTGTTQESGDSASVYAGRNLTDKLSVGTNVAVDGSGKEFVARYKLNRKWSVKTTSSSTASGGELLYTIEFK